MEIYDNSFSDHNVYGHIASLFARFEPAAGSYFLDFGCGFGRLAEVVEERFGVKYVGFDINEPGLSLFVRADFPRTMLILEMTKLRLSWCGACFLKVLQSLRYARLTRSNIFLIHLLRLGSTLASGAGIQFRFLCRCPTSRTLTLAQS